MWLENKVFNEDLRNISKCESVDWQKLNGANVLITGATGLIGFTTLSAVLFSTQDFEVPPTVFALVRNVERAKEKLGPVMDEYGDRLQLVVGDVASPLELNERIDYIVHGASPTASKYFIEHPVETIATAFLGTKNMLEVAYKNQVKGFVYLSSMEAYGKGKEGWISEDYAGDVNQLQVRSSYPEGKRASECLCMCYMSEYNVPVKIARLAQTFGAGVDDRDLRACAEFARCAVESKDIIFKTTGQSRRMYLYTADAATAILCMLLNDKAEGAFNVANEETLASVVETAEAAVASVEGSKSKIILPESDTPDAAKYPAQHNLQLDTSKLRDLGWKPSYNLVEMFRRMIDSWS